MNIYPRRHAVLAVHSHDLGPEPGRLSGTAGLIVQEHGDDAELEATRRADLMLERGDLDGQTVWKRIRRAIGALQAPPTGPET